MKQVLKLLLVVVLSVCMIGCGPNQKNEKVVLTIKMPPVGLGNILDLGEKRIYDLFVEVTEKFQSKYQEYDVEFKINEYNYQDEQTQIADKYGTEEAADIMYSGSWNIPQYVANEWMVSLDDILDDELKSDIDQNILNQNSIDGHLYTMPFQQLQNTLMVNKTMMKKAGLDDYIPANDQIAQWSTDDFNFILQQLKKSLSDSHQFPMMMYAANSQGDNHILTLLRAYGSHIYDEKGNFNVNTSEGIKALEWIEEMNRKGIIPKGSENMELMDNMNLFNNQQLAICIGNLTNLWDSWNKDIDIFTANFPSLDGKGYATSSTNGFCIFNNGDETKIKVAKDFIRFIYTDEDLMKYTLGTLPVNHSVVEKYKDQIKMLEAYCNNEVNFVDNIQNNLNWQGVRDVFYLNIRELLMNNSTPKQTAKDIDQSCNKALEKGKQDIGNKKTYLN